MENNNIVMCEPIQESDIKLLNEIKALKKENARWETDYNKQTEEIVSLFNIIKQLNHGSLDGIKEMI